MSWPFTGRSRNIATCPCADRTYCLANEKDLDSRAQHGRTWVLTVLLEILTALKRTAQKRIAAQSHSRSRNSVPLKRAALIRYRNDNRRTTVERNVSLIGTFSCLFKVRVFVPQKMQGGMKKLKFSSNISEMIEDRWVYGAGLFTSIESSFHPCDISAIVPGAYSGEPKYGKNGHFRN